MIGAIILGCTYVCVALVVGASVADHNRGMLPSERPSPVLRGAFWLPYCITGLILNLMASGAAKPRR